MKVLPSFKAVLVWGAVLASLVTGLTASVVESSSAATPYTVSQRTAAHWMKGYLEAWETRDADAVVKLFTPHAVYESLPGDPTQTFTGRAAIHRYWVEVCKPQSHIVGIQGKPIVTGNRASVEIWVVFRDPVYNPKRAHYVSLLETNVLTFARNGLVSRNVEYWNILAGKHSPPAGWGH